MPRLFRFFFSCFLLRRYYADAADYALADGLRTLRRLHAVAAHVMPLIFIV